MTDVAVIDIAPFREGSPEGMARVAAEVAHACEHIGFFQITGHGIPAAQTTRIYDLARAFFDLPEAAKAEVAQPAPDQVRGWSGVGKEGLSYSLGEEAPGGRRRWTWARSVSTWPTPTSDPSSRARTSRPTCGRPRSRRCARPGRPTSRTWRRCRRP